MELILVVDLVGSCVVEVDNFAVDAVVYSEWTNLCIMVYGAINE